MIRLFQTNKIRRMQELEGLWDFAAVPEDASDAAGVRFTHKLLVPGCWENHPDFPNYRGKGVYRRRIQVERRTSLRLVFKGVSHTGHVFFDGAKIAEHYNAYTAFDAVVRDVEPGEHELAVLVDNSFNEAPALHVPNDYYTYGGLIRPVAVEEIADSYVERISFTPKQDGGRWTAEIEAAVRNIGDAAQAVRVSCVLAGQSFELEAGTAGAGEITVFRGKAVFSDVKAWSPADPQLYALEVKLLVGERVVDDLIDRVGFRVVSIEGERILLNGEPITFKGFNRHEDHPAVGAAIDVSLMMQDLDLMADMGTNAVRTSHYPNDERFLDLCDERGFLVWEENHARGFGLEQMRHPNFIGQCEAVNREMVEQHRNHPSIVIWGILNECASDSEEGRAHYKRQLEQIRAMDDSRPLTYASHHRERELCFDLVDIVSVNLYAGWYTDEDPSELFDRVREWARNGGGAGKPILISEFGADGFYGYRNPNKVRGTEERQAEIIEANLVAALAKPFVAGVFIWQFCDCRVVDDVSGWLITRAGAQNSKGVVDRYRRPKLAYETVKKHFRG